MSSEALLEQPHMFADPRHAHRPGTEGCADSISLSASVQLDVAEQYLELASEEGYGPPHIGYVKAHLFKILHAPLALAGTWQPGQPAPPPHAAHAAHRQHGLAGTNLDAAARTMSFVPDLRPALGGCSTMDEVHGVLQALRAGVQGAVSDDPRRDHLEALQGWYMRRRSEPVA